MRSFAVKIENIFLSHDGVTFNIPASLTIDNFDDLKLQHVGIVSFTASGRAITTVVPSRSVEFEIKIVKLYANVYQQLVELVFSNLNDQAAASSLSDVSFPVEIVGANVDENITLDAAWSPNRPITKNRFVDNHFFDISLRLIKI